MTTHTQGDRVYNRSGHKGEYAGKIENGPYLVRPVLECHSGDEAYTELGHLQEWEEVFERAPVEKIDEQISKKQTQLDEIQAILSQKQSEARLAEAAYKETLERLQKHESLAMLDDFLSGRITHYVLRSDYGDYPSIVEVTETIPTKDSDHEAQYYKRVAVLSFTGRLHGDEVQWTMSNHSKVFWDSGSKVILCRSYDEAVKIVIGICDKGWDEIRSGKNTGGKWVSVANQYGVPVPEDILQGIESAKIADKVKKIADLEAKLEEAKSQLVPVIP